MNEYKEKSILFVFVITLSYFLLSLIGIVYHEVWLDEAHSFLIARDSESFSDLMYNVRLEGHPIVWYLILWFLKVMSSSVFSMQLLHVLISTANIFLLLYYSPFNKITKILFSFSYYFFYEYNIISRNYAICLLCATVFCILICREKRNYILIAFVLVIMSNTHFLGLLLSFSLSVITLVLLFNDESYPDKKNVAIATTLILTIGCFICIYQVIPSEETMFSRDVRPGIFSIRRWSAFSVLLKGLYQFPQLGDKFWNTNLFTENKLLGAVLSIAVPWIIIKVLAHKPLSLFVIISSYLSMALFLFSMLMHNYTVRHWGFVFIGFYIAIWLAEGLNQGLYSETINNVIFKRPPVINKLGYSLFIYSVLSIQFFSACYLYYKDLVHPFSNSKNVADYIDMNGYAKDIIVVSNFTSGPAVSAYLGEKLYYPEYHQLGSFGLWNTFPVFLTKKEILADIYSLKKKGYKRAIMALDKNIFQPQKLNPGTMVMKDGFMEVRHLISFANGIGGNENYDLFLVLFK